MRILKKLSTTIFIFFLLVFGFIPITHVKAVTWDLLDNPWDSVEGWNLLGFGISEIDPPGYLHQKGEPFIQREKDIGVLPNDGYTAEFRCKNLWLSVDDDVSFYFFYDGVYRVEFAIYYNRITVAGGGVYYIDNEYDTFYTWRFVFYNVEGSESFKVYRDGEFLVEFTSIMHVTGNDGLVIVMDIAEGGHSYHDYIKIASGLYPPITDPPGIECQQYANISSYNSTHVIYSLTIWVYNHMGSAQSVNVTPDSSWSTWYIISSLGNNATNSSSFYKNFQRQSSDTNSTIQAASINFTQTQPCNSLLIMIPGARSLIVEEFREESMAAAVIGLLILVPVAFAILILLLRSRR